MGKPTRPRSAVAMLAAALGVAALAAACGPAPAKHASTHVTGSAQPVAKPAGPHGGVDLNVLVLIQVGFVDPVFVLQNMFFNTTAETAVQNVVSGINGLPDAFANQDRTRAQVFPIRPGSSQVKPWVQAC